MKKWVAALVLLSFSVAGCNTVRGAGEDLQSVANKGEEVIN